MPVRDVPRVPPTPATLRTLRRLAVAAALATAGCGAPYTTTDYYADLEQFYALTGGMRTERAPADAPFGDSDLIRNFEIVAFHTEFADDPDALIEEQTPTTLVKWRGEVSYDVIGDAAGPEDERNMRELTDRLARLTGLRFRRTEREPNVLILIANPRMRAAFVRELESRGMGDRIHIIREWVKSDRFPCVGQVGEAGEGPDRRLVAIIGIKGETERLLRTSCLHEEFVQTLGLMNDDDSVRPSIFNDDQEFALLTEHDEYLLRILYDPRLKHGMTAEQGMPLVRRIVAEIGPGERPGRRPGS